MSSSSVDSGDVIVAPATPTGISALAIVRLSGGGSCRIAEHLLDLPSGRLSGSRRAVATASDEHGAIDEVVAISWKSAGSYTGEEMVEITCHGVPELVDRIIAALEKSGARAAAGGEFTRRALLNGRLGPLDIIALGHIWNRRGPEGGFEGTMLTGKAGRLLEGIRDIRIELEGRIEFEDTHGEGAEREQIEDGIGSLLDQARELLVCLRQLRVPVRAVIAGPRNSGKSSLFNALLGERRALVAEEEGTTRDLLVATLELKGRTIELIDTPGTGGSGLDREALALALEGIRAEDRVVWLSVRGEEPPAGWVEEQGHRCLAVSSKADLGAGKGLAVSTVTGIGVEEVREWLADAMPGRAVESGAADLLGHLEASLNALRASDEAVAAEELGEAESLLTALADGSAVGEAVEVALGRLCVGK